MKKYPIVEVEWTDSGLTRGWQNYREHRDAGLCEVQTAGYLLKSDRKKVVVGLSIDYPNGIVGDSITIPRSVVKKIRRLVDK